jgi:hypothetical protein
VPSDKATQLPLANASSPGEERGGEVRGFFLSEGENGEEWATSSFFPIVSLLSLSTAASFFDYKKYRRNALRRMMTNQEAKSICDTCRTRTYAGDPSAFRVHRLNHSANVSFDGNVPGLQLHIYVKLETTKTTIFLH